MLTDIFDEEFIESIIKLLVALLLAGIVGFEREINRHSAGFRTHILVGVSSCLMMILSINGFQHFMENYSEVRFDPARIPSYVISGIGFLGAGTIVVHGGTIHGLTTAASIWTVAGLGLIVGNGMYKEAIVATLVILLSLVVLKKFSKSLNKNYNEVICEVLIKEENLMQFIEDITKRSIHIRKYVITDEPEELKRIKLYIEGVNKKKDSGLLELLANKNVFKKVEIEYRA
ncbi:MgtC/SapB family protein [Virgibacillus necropolis]|uniref:ATPase n=1 Tax=Virgibacillus necropolis TaxID=163877 RepID=A0A221M9K9_9BACI|nr:MgtC/SapB family protein [Virgibacillus necropolis]ASN04325.1 ATPase [Virgibacillus necropolis]